MRLTPAQRFVADHDCVDHPEPYWHGERTSIGERIISDYCGICLRFLSTYTTPGGAHQ